MRFLIDHQGVKRELDGELAICGNRQDLKLLADQLQARLADDTWTFGWVEIREPLPIIPDAKPLPWDVQKDQG